MPSEVPTLMLSTALLNNLRSAGDDEVLALGSEILVSEWRKESLEDKRTLVVTGEAIAKVGKIIIFSKDCYKFFFHSHLFQLPPGEVTDLILAAAGNEFPLVLPNDCFFYFGGQNGQGQKAKVLTREKAFVFRSRSDLQSRLELLEGPVGNTRTSGEVQNTRWD